MSKPLRVLVVDDERLAREKLRRFLGAMPDVAIAGEAANGAQAIDRIRELAPDLVLLDVQMPGCDGFGVLAALPRETLPAVIFVTAHDEHAIRAFEVDAVDYLLKPFERGRLEQAVERARRELARDPAEMVARIERLLEATGAGRAPARRLAIKVDGRITPLPVDEIRWLEADDNYVRVHTARGAHRIRGPLAELERRMDPREFVRVHRSAIVRIDGIVEVATLFHGECEVVLRGGLRLAVGRVYRDRLLACLGDGA
jgi:two-component system LytT family response regulator